VAARQNWTAQVEAAVNRQKLRATNRTTSFALAVVSSWFPSRLALLFRRFAPRSAQPQSAWASASEMLQVPTVRGQVVRAETRYVFRRSPSSNQISCRSSS